MKMEIGKFQTGTQKVTVVENESLVKKTKFSRKRQKFHPTQKKSYEEENNIFFMEKCICNIFILI